MPRKLVPQRFVVGTFLRAKSSPVTAAAWRTILADDALRQRLELPGRLLDDYFRRRHRGPLGGIITQASRTAEWCETLVIVAPGNVAARAEALLRATIHPHHNLLAHGDRGGRPRVVFLEPTLDHDAVQAVLDLLRDDGTTTPNRRWALAVAWSADPVLRQALGETAAPFLALLQEDIVAADAPSRLFFLTDEPTGDEPTGDEAMRAELPLPGAANAVTLAALPDALTFDGTALFAAAVAGADIVALLKGAIWFYETTRTSLAEMHDAVRLADALSDDTPSADARSTAPCELVVWHQALHAATIFFAEHAADGGAGEGGFSVVCGHHYGERQRLLVSHDRRRVHLVSDAIRRDRLGASSNPADEADDAGDDDGEMTAAPLTYVAAPPSLVAAYDEARAAEHTAGVSSAELRLTRLHDQALGELCAWLSTARLVLSRRVVDQ